MNNFGLSSLICEIFDSLDVIGKQATTLEERLLVEEVRGQAAEASYRYSIGVVDAVHETDASSAEFQSTEPWDAPAEVLGQGDSFQPGSGGRDVWPGRSPCPP